MIKLKRITALFMGVMIVFSVLLIDVKAASFGMSASSSTVAPGGSFYVNFGGDTTGRVDLNVSNGSLSTSSVFVDNGRQDSQVIVTAGGSGSVTVTATPVEGFSDANEHEFNPGIRSVTVRIVAPSAGGGNTSGGQTQAPPKDDRSTNNNLASLTTSEGELSPSFNAETTEYKVNLSAKTTKISVDAKAADAKARVTGTGEKELKVGDNQITIIVTAENGATKNYVINAHVDEKPEVYLTYDGKKVGVVRNIEGVKAPATFEKSTVKISGKDIPSWTSKTLNLTLVYLVNEKDNTSNFYIYDTKNGVTSVFKPTAILGNNVYIVDIDKKDQTLEGLTYKKIKVDNTELMGWEFNDKEFKNYSLIYVMDENGKMQYYQYEKTQNTLQKYSGAAPVSQASYDEMSKDLDSANTMKLIFMILSGVFAVTTIVGGVLAMKLRSKIK